MDVSISDIGEECWIEHDGWQMKVCIRPAFQHPEGGGKLRCIEDRCGRTLASVLYNNPTSWRTLALQAALVLEFESGAFKGRN